MQTAPVTLNLKEDYTFSSLDTSYIVICGIFTFCLLFSAFIVIVMIPRYFKGKNRTLPNLNTAIFNYMSSVITFMLYVFVKVCVDKAYSQASNSTIYTEKSIQAVKPYFTAYQAGLALLTTLTIAGFIFYGTLYFYNKNKGITYEVYKQKRKISKQQNNQSEQPKHS